MHEMSIAQALMDQILTAADQHHVTRIRQVDVEVGEMRLVVPEALEAAFTALSRGTLAEGARFVQTVVPITARCHACGREFTARPGELACPDCHQADIEILAGDDIILKSLVGDSPGEAPSTPETPDTLETNGA